VSSEALAEEGLSTLSTFLNRREGKKIFHISSTPRSAERGVAVRKEKRYHFAALRKLNFLKLKKRI